MLIPISCPVGRTNLAELPVGRAYGHCKGSLGRMVTGSSQEPGVGRAIQKSLGRAGLSKQNPIEDPVSLYGAIQIGKKQRRHLLLAIVFRSVAAHRREKGLSGSRSFHCKREQWRKCSRDGMKPLIERFRTPAELSS